MRKRSRQAPLAERSLKRASMPHQSTGSNHARRPGVAAGHDAPHRSSKASTSSRRQRPGDHQESDPRALAQRDGASCGRAASPGMRAISAATAGRSASSASTKTPTAKSFLELRCRVHLGQSQHDQRTGLPDERAQRTKSARRSSTKAKSGRILASSRPAKSSTPCYRPTARRTPSASV